MDLNINEDYIMLNQQLLHDMVTGKIDKVCKKADGQLPKLNRCCNTKIYRN